MRRIYGTALATLVGLSLAAGRGYAEFLPTFSPDVHGLKATHVVVVSEGDSLDGDVEVLESWRGDLRPGAHVKVDGLAKLESSDDARLCTIDEKDFDGKPFGRATFRRVLLFLVRTPAGFGPCYLDLASCLVAIEGEKAYAMIQPINPGPRFLAANDRPAAAVEAELRAMVVRIDDQCRRIAEILSDDRPRERAKLLEPLVADLVVGRAALSGLQGCGRDAMPALWRLYRGGAGAWYRPELMRAIVAVGGVAEAPTIATLLHGETEYWKATAPTLSPSSWMPPLYQRWVMLEDLLDGLGSLGAPVGRPDAEALLSLADAYPQFAHATNGTMTPVHDAVHAYLHAIKPPPPNAK